MHAPCRVASARERKGRRGGPTCWSSADGPATGRTAMLLPSPHNALTASMPSPEMSPECLRDFQAQEVGVPFDVCQRLIVKPKQDTPRRSGREAVVE